MQATLNQELQGLKECMADYQLEFEQQKQQFQEQIKQQKAQKKRSGEEMVKLQKIIQDQEKQFRKDLELKCLEIVDLEDQLRDTQNLLSDQKLELETKLKQQSQKSESNIRYYQQRLAHLTEEITQAPVTSHQVIDASIRQDLLKLGQEVVQVRGVLTKAPAEFADRLDLLKQFRREFSEQTDTFTDKATLINQDAAECLA
jgi:DNA repair exonuclease SbcCD ATPase subunit